MIQGVLLRFHGNWLSIGAAYLFCALNINYTINYAMITCSKLRSILVLKNKQNVTETSNE